MRAPRAAAAALTLGLMVTGPTALGTPPLAHGADANGTVVGNLTLVTLPMPQYQDGRTRTVRIWTPAGYNPKDTKRKYPVLYMHDGQNLFDAATSFAGEWEVDESLTQLMGDGYSGGIVVGVDNSKDRLNELSPPWPRIPGAPMPAPSGDKYARFIVDTVKPYVDAHFRTLPDRANTGIGGSSMGGIISFYMGLEHPDVFGKVLVFSPSFPFYVKKDYLARIAKHDFRKPEAAPRMYLYSGGSGDGDMSEGGVARLLPVIVGALKKAGYPASAVTTYVWEVGQHSEGFWREVFPTAYQWLFLTDTDRAGMAAHTLSLDLAPGDTLDNVTADIGLPTTWDYGAKVAWKSSAPKVVSNSGKFTRPSHPTTVTLTATVTVGKAKQGRAFAVRILAR